MFDDEKACGNDFPDFNKCKAQIEKFLTVCIPVTTTPSINVGKIKTECCGNPIISMKNHDNCCKGVCDGSCKFTIIQKMKVEIPIDFNADTDIDELFVDCELKHEHEPPKPDCDCRP